MKKLGTSAWNRRTAAHLLARAGFGGTPEEIERLTGLGLDAAVGELVDYEQIPDVTSPPDWAKPDPDRAQRLRAMRLAAPDQKRELFRAFREHQRDHLIELRAWWLRRMVNGPRPLEEKLTLFWHGHFATSMIKVQDAYLMWRQNETFRRLASGNWRQMLDAVSKDPAMLIWLDQAQSRKEHPNENYARELMELFTLGEGHYTENDVLEAARALTGWSYNRATQDFLVRPFLHDGGVKTFLGRAGNLDGADILDQIVAQPQAARFIVAKLWSYFAQETPPDEVVSALAAELRQAGNGFKPVLRSLFGSEAFYADSVMASQVKSPVQWLVSSVRLLGRDLPPPLLTTGLLHQLGQDLFAPPNVKGWDGGVSWITTTSLLNRYRQATFLVMGAKALPGGQAKSANREAQPGMPRRDEAMRAVLPIDAAKIAGEGDRRNPDALMAALQARLLLVPLRSRQEATLRAYLDTRKTLDDRAVLNAIRLVMSTPEYQLT